jgi:hypothetical protein
MQDSKLRSAAQMLYSRYLGGTYMGHCRYLLGTLVVCWASLAGAASQGSVIDYRNERFGFSLSVPGDVFVAGTPRNPEVGGLWISRDRQARLLAVAGRNETGETLQSYRTFVMRESYGSASFGYAPVRDDWFVLSGIQGDQAFYERVDFVCNGRYIYGWQIMYPATERQRYDRVVQAIHRSYRPGRGEDGNCQ